MYLRLSETKKYPSGDGVWDSHHCDHMYHYTRRPTLCGGLLFVFAELVQRRRMTMKSGLLPSHDLALLFTSIVRQESSAPHEFPTSTLRYSRASEPYWQ